MNTFLAAAESTQGGRLVVAPYVEGEFICDDAVRSLNNATKKQAGLYCAEHGKTAAANIEAALRKLGPAYSPSGHYALGYTLALPLFDYYQKTKDGWVFRGDYLRQHLKTLDQIDRPAVIYISMNHFTEPDDELSLELSRDKTNLMWAQNGPMTPAQYFGYPTIGWTLVDMEAPINRMRRHAISNLMQEICTMKSTARNKVVGISLLGEVHHMFPDVERGPGFDVSPYEQTDYAPLAKAAFRNWLREKYQTVQSLNIATGYSYGTFDEIQPPTTDVYALSRQKFRNHLDSYASGDVPVYGWIYEHGKPSPKVAIYLDGVWQGDAESGLNRTDVTDAMPHLRSPNLGFRYNLNFRALSNGRHVIDVIAVTSEGRQASLGRREIFVRGGKVSPQMGSRVVTGLTAKSLSDTPEIIGGLDGPPSGQRLLYNPIAEEWLAFRNYTIRQYIESFAKIAGSYCVAPEKIFSHQITPSLNGSWNGNLIAVDDSKLPSPYFNQGTTLYGGAAYSDAFSRMRKKLGWKRYAVTEMHPILPLSQDQYRDMFELHRKSGAVYVAPYYLSIVPANMAPQTDLVRFEISPKNKRYGSDLFYEAIRSIMRQ